MKKKFLILTITLLLLSASISSGSASSASFPCYSFDLSVSINTDAFPASEQTRIRGYSDLFDNIRLKGQLVCSESSNVINLYTELIPLSNPSSSISFQLNGIPSHLILTSPLLGNQSIAFNNLALLEFSVKAYQYLGFPLQYFSLLFPYVHESAFESSTQIWKQHFGNLNNQTSIMKNDIRSFATDLESTINNDRSFYYWIEALGIESGYSEILHDELSDISGYIIDSLTKNSNVTVSVSEDTKKFSASENDFLELCQNENLFSIQFVGTATQQGNIPSMRYSYEHNENTVSFSSEFILANEEEDFTLIDLAFDGEQIPESFPVDTSFAVSLSQNGDILPIFFCKANICSNSEGHIDVDFYLQRENDSSLFNAFSVNGTVSKSSTETEPQFSYDEFMQSFNIFSINDLTLPQFVNSVIKSLVSGILSFLEEVPASSFQSIMNDLTDSGILNMLLMN